MKPSRRRELAATLHLTEDDVCVRDGVVTDATMKARPEQVILAWVGRHDIALTITGVRHCGGAEGG